MTVIDYRFLSSDFWIILVDGESCSDSGGKKESKTECLFFWLHSCVSTWTGSENCLYNGHLIHLQAFCNFSLPDPFYFKNNNSSDAGLLYYPLRFLYIPSTYKKYFCLIVFEAFTDPLKIPRPLLFISIYLVRTTKKNVSELYQTLKSSEGYSSQKTKDKCVFFF